jgi:DNA replication protein DnaC
MLTHPTLDKLKTLKFSGMANALEEQWNMAEFKDMTFEERLGLLIDREMTERDNRKLTSRLRRARLKHNAALEDIDYRHPRGLDKSLIRALAQCQWVRDKLNILITGPTGVGKTWLACALAQKACREGHSALYLRLPRLLQDMTIAKGDGRYTKLLNTLAKTEVLVLDDWGITKPNAENRRDLLELLEDRHGNRSTLATSQLPIDQWHTVIGDPTLADAILDRLLHNAYKINLKGESMRKKQSKLTKSTLAKS